MTLLHIFDMDGTLLRGTSASLLLAEHLEVVDEVHDLERASAAGKLSNREFHRRTHRLWQGRLTPEAIHDVFTSAPWMNGLAEVFADIDERGDISAVISMSPRFFVDGLRERGAHYVYASENPLDRQFDPDGVLEGEDKVRIAQSLLHKLREILPVDDDIKIVAYGDSYTDIPLFESGVPSVAVNASPVVEALATTSYRGRDLTRVLALGRALATNSDCPAMRR
ncbi:hypothetical protein BJF89_16455 [Corynebacterium sp. CNJ-954]|uniref:HAD family hydrolase n=1 Tax=Corynebacterium sp. CNJ-954 TaxID=1904962 RepID=UPI0009631859|nr:HAD-IB family phosphatase [Corynebacterium sp. CNJ-954]OLT54606.1 hypothetical protein BJF89_16455 [Corynebacterium sp. CNJ-954]